MAKEILNGKQTVERYHSMESRSITPAIGPFGSLRQPVPQDRRGPGEGLPGKTLPDLKTAELDAWLDGLGLAAKTKNGMRIVLVACGNWAEGWGYLIEGGSPFPAVVRYKETKSAVPIFTPENIASPLTKADVTLRPFLALSAFAGLRTAELQRLDWKEIDLDRGFITVDVLAHVQISFIQNCAASSSYATINYNGPSPVAVTYHGTTLAGQYLSQSIHNLLRNTCECTSEIINYFFSHY